MNLPINDKDFLLMFFWNYIQREHDRSYSQESSD